MICYLKPLKKKAKVLSQILIHFANFSKCTLDAVCVHVCVSKFADLPTDQTKILPKLAFLNCFSIVFSSLGALKTIPGITFGNC